MSDIESMHIDSDGYASFKRLPKGTVRAYFETRTDVYYNATLELMQAGGVIMMQCRQHDTGAIAYINFAAALNVEFEPDDEGGE